MNRIISLFFTCVVFAFAAYAVYRFYEQPHTVPTASLATTSHQQSENRKVPDFSVASIGEFAGQEFAPILEQHIANLEKYRSFSFEPLSMDERQSLGSSLAKSIVHQHSTWSNAELPIELADQILLRLFKASSLSPEQYQSFLGIARFSAPPQLLDASYVQDVFEDSLHMISDPQSDDQILAALEEIDRLSLGKSYLQRRLVAVSTSPDSVRVATRMMGASTPAADMLSDTLSDVDQSLFLGNLAQGQLVFSSFPNSQKATEQVLRAEVVLIVEDQGGDRYPIVFRFEFDANKSCWILMQALRCSSPRVGSSLSFAF
jgi:hypothetical protein